ncbi:long-chain-acyl-CoA synthetase [Asticcacaulis sp. AND118]|uniref:long-chain-acyl-CoA synthetase n=1 Tax=Asticcacaulis sp. AND118 TaxID=2840468 RepID=UPI001D0006BF|nr:long-chain-acyl-CoA synthetase [Asticcacaulis sp. AND118]UDF04359.1 long-chain-acyl-CoA synthetase [Asticcacaulis sp. AND118]
MNLIDRARREFIFLKRLLRLLRHIREVDSKSPVLVCDDLEASVDRHAARIALLFEDKTLTYAEMDVLANRVANWGLSRGLKPGDTVALFLPNRLEYVPIWYGLSKIGVITALINNALTGQGLAHCINISTASLNIVDPATLPAFAEIEPTLTRRQEVFVLDLAQTEETSHHHSLSQALKGASSVRPDRRIRQGLIAHDPALYIYTSGTTGLPKAAKITHARAQLYMKAFRGVSHMTDEDRLYNALPLYHSTGGLCGVGAALLNGGSMVIKRRFSASAFWHDVRSLNCTHIVYIGELCRYLVNAPISPDPDDETKHRLKVAFGNGMRPEVWTEFKTRFKVPVIIEFYGSTEGNVSLFNFDGQAGAIGRAPSYLRNAFNIRLVQFDVEAEAPVRGPDGLCIECKPGEVGEAIGAIGADARHFYTGYADKAASEKKVLHDVFKKGDAWFRSGDLMKMDRDGYIYFVDRIGDTFRFKGENVSTSEVGECCARAEGVDEAIVYGVPVPHYDGKAGMVSLITGEGFSIEAFAQHVNTHLPVFARPRFVRLLQNAETTGTFKYKKMDLVQAGFDPAKVTDPLYVMKMDDTGYKPLTAECMTHIETGQYRM